MNKRKYFYISFPDLEQIVLEERVKQKNGTSYSELCLRKRFNNTFKIENGEVFCSSCEEDIGELKQENQSKYAKEHDIRSLKEQKEWEESRKP